MGLFNKKLKTIDSAVKDWYIKSKDAKKTFVIATIHKKNKKLYNAVVQLDGEIITIDKSPHYAGNDSIFYKTQKIGKRKIDIPIIDVYEGMNLAVHPSKDLTDLKFSKRVVDMIGLKIEQGVLENHKKNKIDIKKILLSVLIGGAAIFVIIKMFG